jgi:hypothetical protein
LLLGGRIGLPTAKVHSAGQPLDQPTLETETAEKGTFLLKLVNLLAFASDGIVALEQNRHFVSTLTR